VLVAVSVSNGWRNYFGISPVASIKNWGAQVKLVKRATGIAENRHREFVECGTNTAKII
jgi:hypothetical protein